MSHAGSCHPMQPARLARITGVDFPPELVDLQARFLTAEAEWRRAAEAGDDEAT